MKIRYSYTSPPYCEEILLASEDAILTTSISSGQQIGDTEEEDDWGTL